MSTLTTTCPPDLTERIDPSAVPQRTLSSGGRMPGIGLGTFGSDHVSPELVASWLAMNRAACQTGSRADWAIMLATQESYGSWSSGSR